MLSQTLRYAPTHVRFGPHGSPMMGPPKSEISQVVSYITYPPGKHPNTSPIRKDLTALELACANGRSRWYGFQRAWINSELRMVVQGYEESFEEVNAWEVCLEPS